MLKYSVETPRCHGYGEGGVSAILASPKVTIQAVVAMVTVPVIMVTGLDTMEKYGVLHQDTKMAVTFT